MHEADIAKLVKELREWMKLTQERFAQKVGVTYSTVNRWENGKRMPQPFLVRRLLELKEELGAGKSDEGTSPPSETNGHECSYEDKAMCRNRGEQ